MMSVTLSRFDQPGQSGHGNTAGLLLIIKTIGIDMNREKIFCRQQGFTLVELMVTLVISFVIAGAAYSAYVFQQKSYVIQEDVAEMQQNIRVALAIMTREMRMAGYDPTFSGEYGIVSATANQFNFTSDLCQNGGVPGTCTRGGQSITETYLYELYDSSGDGEDDALRRTPGGSAVADNIEHLEFVYVLRDGIRTQVPTPSEMKRIVSIEVSILARSPKQDHRYSDSQTYTTGSGIILGPYYDKYRRRLIVTTLQLRNMAYRT